MEQLDSEMLSMCVSICERKNLRALEAEEKAVKLTPHRPWEPIVSVSCFLYLYIRKAG